MRASWLMAVLCFLSAPAMAADFFAKDKSLTALPAHVDGVVRAHWTFAGYQDCEVVGKTINLAEPGETEGYVATTADECAWLSASAPIWVVERVDGALQMVASDTGYSLTMGEQSKNGLRHILLSTYLAGSFFESFWEFNGLRYIKLRDRSEISP